MPLQENNNDIFQLCYVLHNFNIFPDVHTHLNISSVSEIKQQSKHQTGFYTVYILGWL
jgi:hypothetical protein